MRARIVTIVGVTYGYVGIAPPFDLKSETAFRLTDGRWIPSHHVYHDGPSVRCRPTGLKSVAPDTIALLDRAYVERLAEDA